MENQELEKIIKHYPIINSFYICGLCDLNGDLIRCIPIYTKELRLWIYLDIQLEEYEFPSSLELLYLHDCKLSLNCWNSIPSSLSSFICRLCNIIKFDENGNKIGAWHPGFRLNVKNLELDEVYINLAKLKIWPQNLIRLEIINSTISSDEILNLSKILTLSYLTLLGIKEIAEIDLSNFNSLKSLTYRPTYDNQQHIYFPSSLETLILDNCTIKNVKSTKLPNSLIHVEFCIFHSYPDPDFISFLLKEENKLPLLRTYSFHYERKEFLLDEYHKLKSYYQTVVRENSIRFL